MSNFYFRVTDDDDTVTTVKFNSETWVDAFPKFLDVCRGAGFNIHNKAVLYSPTISEKLFGDRDFLLFEENISEYIKPKNNSDTVEHTKEFYDTTRNR